MKVFGRAVTRTGMPTPGAQAPRAHKLTNVFSVPHVYTPSSSSTSHPLVSTRRIHTPLPPLRPPSLHLSPSRPRPPDRHRTSSAFSIHPPSTALATPTRCYGGVTHTETTREPPSSSPAPFGRSLEDIAMGRPYLEAYEVIEDFADVLLDEEAMVTERPFSGDVARGPPDAPPLPAALIPGPKSWPLLGCLPYMLRHPAFDPNRVYLFWQATAQEFGPIFRKDMPGHPNLVFITDPEDVFTMFHTTMLNPVRPGMTSLKKIREDNHKEREKEGRGCPAGDLFCDGTGILAEQGERWWRVRRRVQKPITDQAIISRFLPDMDEVARAFVRRIRNLRDGNQEMPHTFKDEIYKWSLESLATVALERRLNCFEDDLQASPESSRLILLAKQLLEALHETENVKLWQYFPTASISRLREAHDVFSECVTICFLERRRRPAEAEGCGALFPPGPPAPGPQRGAEKSPKVLSEFTVGYKHEDIHLVNKLGYGPSHPLRFTLSDRN
ncbi:ecdysone 20-monooxygenase-like [Penaeus chinensis]|uniref:ecdysone 20-monooxygenase-like n=1 Tax=Penaeus chinensis TaxID=139456 RepID=UPI001FB84E30|nr:ecdysone 20-monooxygenase-like [Penaeus chinensis]